MTAKIKIQRLSPGWRLRGRYHRDCIVHAVVRCYKHDERRPATFVIQGVRCILLLIPEQGGWVVGPVEDRPDNVHLDRFLGKRLRVAWAKLQLLMDAS